MLSTRLAESNNQQTNFSEDVNKNDQQKKETIKHTKPLKSDNKTAASKFNFNQSNSVKTLIPPIHKKIATNYPSNSDCSDEHLPAKRIARIKKKWPKSRKNSQLRDYSDSDT